jgi:hypothetical protein
LPALLLTWALSHAVVFGDDEPRGDKGRKGGSEPVSIERIRQMLDQPITLDFSGQSVQEALQHLRDKTGIDFNLDQMALAIMGININDNGDQPVMLKSNGAKLGVALRKMLNSHQLAYVIFEDSVLITSTELATHRQMKQRVNLDVNEIPLAKALRDLARTYAFNLVIDPKIAKDSQKPVSLALDGASLETSVRLLAEMAGVKAVRMDNVLFVTTEERAEKIRKEEKDMMPNPLDDPTLPIPRIGGAALNFAIPGPGIRVLPPQVPAPAGAVDAPPAPPPGVSPAAPAKGAERPRM